MTINWKTKATPDKAAYEQARWDFFVAVEESRDPKSMVYVDSKGIPTIGVGFNLREPAVRDEVLRSLGFEYERDSVDTNRLVPKSEEQIYVNRIIAIVNQSWVDTTEAESSLQAQLDAVMADRFGDSRITAADVRPDFMYQGDLEIKATFDVLIERYETEVLDRWSPNLPLWAPERIALLSLAYNSRLAEYDSQRTPHNDKQFPSLLGPGLWTALQAGDRAKAWFEIRYGSNKEQDRGIAKRRYYESELFGLYDDPANVSDPEAKRVYGMYTANRQRILTYEAAFGGGADGGVGGSANRIDAANSDYLLSGIARVDTLVQALEPAGLVLKDAVRAQITDPIALETISARIAQISNADIQVISTAYSSSQVLNGTTHFLYGGTGVEGNVAHEDLLIGDEGRNTLNGGGGHDVLYGAQGDDQLFGGDGQDAYVYGVNHGKDTITDTDNNNEIYAGGRLLRGTADGEFKYVNDTWTINDGDLIYKLVDGNLIITGSALGAGEGNQITVTDIADTKAAADRFGITLERQDKVALTDESSNPFLNPDFSPGQVDREVGEGGGKSFNVATNRQLSPNDKLTLALDSTSGIDPSRIRVVTGDQLLDFASGEITLTPNQAQSMIQLALIVEGDVPADAVVTIKAILETEDENGVVQTAESNLFKLDVRDSSGAAPQAQVPATSNTITGDPLIHTETIAPGGQGSDWAVVRAYNHEYTEIDGRQTLTAYTVDYFIRDADGNPTELGGPERKDVLNGTAGNDHLIGLLGDDVLSGNGGDDLLDGGAGEDHLLGLSGNDVLNGGDDDDWLEGGAGQDRLAGDGGRDEAYGGDGDDIVAGGADADLLYGEAGNDRMFGGDEISVEQALLDGNTQFGNGLRGDWINGGAGNDQLIGGASNDVLFGGGGSDLLIGGAGDDFLFGDTDWFTYNFNWTVTEQNGSFLFEPVSGIEDPEDSAADVIYAGNGDDYVWAGAGDDIALGEDGNDAITGDAGSDVLLGGSGDDRLWGDSVELDPSQHGKDFLDGGDGNDELTGDGNDDTLYGGAGNDTLWGDDSDIPVEAHGNDYLDGEDGDDTLYGMGGDDVLYGGDGNDILVGHNDDGSGADPATRRDGNNRLFGEAGDDQLFGGIGDDLLDGGEGNDELYGGEGTDYLDGGAGDDILHTDGGNSTLSGGDGNDQLGAFKSGNLLDGGAGNDTLITEGGGNTLFGGAGDDTLSAAGGNNYLDGGEGNNTLIADGGNNMLFAGSGADTLSSTGGNSYLSGGAGNDTLIAGDGGNTLVGGDGDDFMIASGPANVMDGGFGRDIYAFDAGFGLAQIVDPDVDNRLQFNFNFMNSGMTVGLGSLMLSFANGDELHIEGYDPEDPYGSSSISTFSFSDRTLSLAEVIELGGTAVNFTIGPDIIGTEQADTLVGTDKAEKIYGLGGNDTIDGGGRGDEMHGGDGHDTYRVDNVGDHVIEDLNAGWDLVESSVSFTLGDNVEALTLTGLAAIDGTGNVLSNRIEGNDAANVLTGLAGDDELYGNGGNDRLDGGSGADELYGGDGDDTLVGGSGNDVLDGGAGADVMSGGSGDDFYRVDDAGDTVTELGGEGIDKVQSSVSYALGDHVENLILSGSAPIDGIGNLVDNEITGNAAANTLVGGAGNDSIFGGGGADTMIGGTGDDRYHVNQSDDVVIENPDEGYDRVDSNAISYRLADHVEELSLSGAAEIGIGNDQDNLIQGLNSFAFEKVNYALFGEGGNDTLLGNIGDDWLDGGSGADTMRGGLGADIYVVDDVGDRVVEEFIGPLRPFSGYHFENGVWIWGPYEAPVAEVDSVVASISYTLGANLENLQLLGTDDLVGNGNGLSNVLTGNAGNNTLRGFEGDDTLDGGAGADRLEGGSGNDLYIVDNAGDQAVETAASGGYDTVHASVTWTLGEHLENLYLTGSDAIDGTGNALNNQIVGNDADNTLSGEAGHDTLRGGAGNDSLFGGAGSDWLDGEAGADYLDGGDGGDHYFVDDLADVVVDSGTGMERDTVSSFVDFTLTDSLEDLYLLDDAIVGTGNDQANQIIGNLRNNILSGLSGDDWISGGSGDDTIDGGDGDDYLDGGSDDWIWYGDGRADSNRDWINGGTGNDTIDGGSDNDTIYGGDGDDDLYGGYDGDSEGGGAFLPGDDAIYGEAGNDIIDGGTGNDYLSGGDGDDTIYGNRYANYSAYYYDPQTDTYVQLTDNDVIDGGAGNDIIDGGEGDDYIDGGSGWDQLAGGQGDDVFVVDGEYEVDSGVLVRNDCGDWVTTTTLVWDTDQVIEWAGQGYDLVLSSASYVLPANVEALTLTFDPAMIGDDPLRYADLVVYGQNGYGNDLDNLIIGSALNNRLEGGEGDDTIHGGDGDDTLVGDGGNDTLRGGAGNDRYVLRWGDGNDQAFDHEGADTLHVGSELSSADLEFENDNGSLVVRIADSGDSITFDGWFSNSQGLSQITFCDGEVMDRSAIRAMIDAPLPLAPIPAQGTPEDAPFSFTLPDDAFEYAAGTEALDFEVTLANGRPLPAWLEFDPVSRTLSGTPDNWDVGDLAVRVTAINAAGKIATSDFALEVWNVNDAPVATSAIENQAAMEDAPFAFRPAGVEAALTRDDTDLGTAPMLNPEYDAYVWGSASGDTYDFGRGSGFIRISDWDYTRSGQDLVRFGDGISPADIRVTTDQWGDLTLAIDGTDDALTIAGAGLWPEARIEVFSFVDGTTWSGEELMAQVSRLPTPDNDLIEIGDEGATVVALAGDDAVMGGAADDTILGGAGHDYLNGGPGSDLLFGGSGDDELEADWDWTDLSNDLLSGGDGSDGVWGALGNDLVIGGEGDDYLAGDNGKDVILFNRGDGSDTYFAGGEVDDEFESRIDTVSLGGGIAPGDLSLSREFEALVLHVGNGERIAFEDWYATWMDRRSVGTLQLISAAADSSAENPLLSERIQQFDFLALVGAFDAAMDSDPNLEMWNIGDRLAEFRTGSSDTAAIGGAIAFLYATEGSFDRLSESAIRAQLTAPGFGQVPQSIAVEAAGVFTDDDFIHGDALSFSATRADGSALPDWLSFDPATQTFSGAPGDADVGELEIALTATDLAGASATQRFTISVAGTNDAPTAANDVFTVDEDSGVAEISAASLLANDTDPDLGDQIRVVSVSDTATGLPVNLADGAVRFDFGDRFQALSEGQTAIERFHYTIADLAGETTMAEVSVTVVGRNDAPTAVDDTHTTREDAADPVAGNLLTNDVDTDAGDALSVLSPGDFVGQFGMLTVGHDGGYQYVLANELAGVQSLAEGELAADVFAYQATDGMASAAGDLTISIVGANDAPIAVTPLADQQFRAGAPMAWQLAEGAFADIDRGDVLSYSASLADGAELPEWLSFDSASSRFQGEPARSDAGIYEIRVTATDRWGASAEQRFALTIDAPDTPPLVASDVLQMTEDSIVVDSLNLLANDVDNDGDALAVGDPGVRNGAFGSLTIGADGNALYQLDNASLAVQSLGESDLALDGFTYLATDGRNPVQGNVTVSIRGRNDIPVLVSPLADLALGARSMVSWAVPRETFADIDASDTLTASASLANGSALPDWLSFDTDTWTFSGTVPANASGSLQIRVTASDGHGPDSVASDVFQVSFAKGNEGVGNGDDPPPPGHEDNYNDGCGTGPGNPGRRGGPRDDDDDSHRSDRKSHKDNDWISGWGDHGTNRTDVLDCSLLDRHRGRYDDSDSHDRSGERDFNRRWGEMEQALRQLDKGRKGHGDEREWRGHDQGADIRMPWAGHDYDRRGRGCDPISLAVGSGTHLKGFGGLKDGLKVLDR